MLLRAWIVITLLYFDPTDNVLQDFVECMTDVQTPIRIRRSIVQHKGLLARALAALPLVKVIGASFGIFWLIGYDRPWSGPEPAFSTRK